MTRMTKRVKLEQRKDSFSVCCRPLFIYLCPFEAKRLSSYCTFTFASRTRHRKGDILNKFHIFTLSVDSFSAVQRLPFQTSTKEISARCKGRVPSHERWLGLVSLCTIVHPSNPHFLTSLLLALKRNWRVWP